MRAASLAILLGAWSDPPAVSAADHSAALASLFVPVSRFVPSSRSVPPFLRGRTTQRPWTRVRSGRGAVLARRSTMTDRSRASARGRTPISTRTAAPMGIRARSATRERRRAAIRREQRARQVFARAQRRGGGGLRPRDSGRSRRRPRERATLGAQWALPGAWTACPTASSADFSQLLPTR
jgi:hypothetical protein